ncbi:MAG: hydroxyacid dehydrogenase [Clostridia bacterium]|nr:hydroxyacid dehydrogenase [Clostridia bacterium]
MKISILDASTLGADLDLSVVSKVGDVTVYPTTSTEEINAHCKGNDVLILNKVKINESTLTDYDGIKLICITATGFDNVDLDFCRSKGIAVCNVVGYSTNSVAQVTVAVVLSLANHLSEFMRHVQSGAYTKGGVANCLTPVYTELEGKKWGIVGCGNIGTKVGKIAEALGCKVLAFKRTPHESFETVDIDTLCKECDIITVHAPLSDVTKHLINRERLSKMKKNVILVNAARGAVTDEEAVAEAIEKEIIGAFGTDVYSVEPFSENHPFTRIMNRDNVCLTPHMAWGAKESRERCLSEVINNIKSFFAGETRNRVDI